MLLNKSLNPLNRCNLKFGETGVDAVTNGLFAGYACVFGGDDAYKDTIVKGAFADFIEGMERKPLMLYGHGSMNAVGKWLKIEEDEVGLWVEGELTPNHTLASDCYASLKHGAVDGMSIGFRIPKGGYTNKPKDCDCEDGDWCPHFAGRTITKIDLVEISIVSFPADDAARVATVKAVADDISAIESLRECEVFLRDAGFSRSMAKAFISQCRPLYQREVDAEVERKEAMQRDLEWLHKLTD